MGISRDLFWNCRIDLEKGIVKKLKGKIFEIELKDYKMIVNMKTNIIIIYAESEAVLNREIEKKDLDYINYNYVNNYKPEWSRGVVDGIYFLKTNFSWAVRHSLDCYFEEKTLLYKLKKKFLEPFMRKLEYVENEYPVLWGVITAIGIFIAGFVGAIILLAVAYAPLIALTGGFN